MGSRGDFKYINDKINRPDRIKKEIYVIMLKFSHSNQTEKFRLKEPIIVSGQYYEIKMLSVYDFMLCSVMYKRLAESEIFEGIEDEIIQNVCEQASIVARCLYNMEGRKDSI